MSFLAAVVVDSWMESLIQLTHMSLKGEIEALIGHTIEPTDQAELLHNFSQYNTWIDIKSLGDLLLETCKQHMGTGITLCLPDIIRQIENLEHANARVIGFTYLLGVINTIESSSLPSNGWKSAGLSELRQIFTEQCRDII